MTELFIPYEQALALKELSFDDICLSYFKDGKFSEILEDVTNSQIGGVNSYIHEYIAAPLYQQAFKWFRDNGFHSVILPKMTPSNNVVYYIYDGKPKKNWDNCFVTYEQAELECLKKLIEIAKSK